MKLLCKHGPRSPWVQRLTVIPWFALTQRPSKTTQLHVSSEPEQSLPGPNESCWDPLIILKSPHNTFLDFWICWIFFSRVRGSTPEAFFGQCRAPLPSSHRRPAITKQEAFQRSLQKRTLRLHLFMETKLKILFFFLQHKLKVTSPQTTHCNPMVRLDPGPTSPKRQESCTSIWNQRNHSWMIPMVIPTATDYFSTQSFFGFLDFFLKGQGSRRFLFFRGQHSSHFIGSFEPRKQFKKPPKPPQGSPCSISTHTWFLSIYSLWCFFPLFPPTFTNFNFSKGHFRDIFLCFFTEQPLGDPADRINAKSPLGDPAGRINALPLYYGQYHVNDIRPTKLGKTWDTCRIARDCCRMWCGFLAEVHLGYSQHLCMLPESFLAEILEHVQTKSVLGLVFDFSCFYYWKQ